MRKTWIVGKMAWPQDVDPADIDWVEPLDGKRTTETEKRKRRRTPSHIPGDYGRENQVNYHAEATRRWPTARIIGDGRYCVIAQNGGVVYLAKTELQQRSISLGVDKSELVDLVVRDIMAMVEEMPDRYPD